LAFYALDKAMDKPIIKSDIFKGKISEATEKAVGSYEKMKNDAEANLKEMAWSQTKVTQTMIDDLVNQYKQMGDRVLKELERQHNDQKAKMVETFARNSGLSEAQENKILANMDKNYAERVKKVKGYTSQQIKIQEDSVKKNGKITNEAALKVEQIEKNKEKIVIQSTSKSATEQKAILKGLKTEAGEITAKQAGDVVANSKKQRDKTVSEAKKQYNESVKEIKRMRDVTGELTADQATKMIKNAKNQKDKVVNHAEEMHENVVAEAQSQAGEHADQVNWETGQVLSGWDKMYNGIAKAWNWIADFFGGRKMEIKGAYKESGRAKLKRQDASFAAYAKGTRKGTHKGGLALVGEEGYELAHIPNQGTGLLGVGGQEFVNLPKGSSVLPHKHTKSILKQYGFPMYAEGIGDYFDIFVKGKDAVWNLLKNKFSLTDSVLPKWFSSNSGNVLENIGKVMKNKLKSVLGSIFSAGDYSGAGSDQARKWILSAMKITNTPLRYLNGLMAIAGNESTFNPHAINLWDSNAKAGHPSKGLFQTIDSTFNKYKLSGLGDIWNPIANAVAAIRYMVSRYGDISNVPGLRNLSGGNGYVGYANGGFIFNEQLARIGEGNKPEVIIPLDRGKRTRAMQLLSQAAKCFRSSKTSDTNAKQSNDNSMVVHDKTTSSH
jgi:SLT domain-containing protein/phage-related tail protein